MIICPWNELSRYASVIPGLEEAMKIIDAHDPKEYGTFPLPNGRFMAGIHTSRSAEGCQAEAHRRFLDIQYVLTGQDVLGWAPISRMTPA